MNKAIFLDRDGVINHDPGDYTCRLSEFTVLPDVYPALKQFQDRGYLLILITNQGGIAKGLYTHEEVQEIHDYFSRECKSRGIELCDVFYSPHHESTGKSLSRKPGSLMLERVIARYNIDPEKSFMIGDKDRDLQAASGAGVRGIKIPVNGSLLGAFQLIVSEYE